MTRKEPTLPFEVEIELLDSLHGSLKSLAAGTLGVAGVAVVCAFTSQNSLLRVLALLLLAATIGRVVTTFAYLRAKHDFTRSDLKRWTSITLLSSTVSAALLGACGAIGVFQVSEASVSVPLVVVVTGYAASASSRNAGVPTSVFLQFVLTIVPLSLAFALKGGAGNFAIAMFLFFGMISMIGMSRSVYDTLVKALTLAREKHGLADALADQAVNFNAALSNMSHGLAMINSSDRLVICNRRFAEFFSLDDESGARGASPSQIFSCAARAGLVSLDAIEQIKEQFVERTRSHARDEMTLALRDGRTIELSFQSMEHGGAVVIVHDVTERRAQQAKIAHMARFDNLTGLPNRLQFEEKFAELLAQNARAEKPFAVVCIDLDHFKEVNDTLDPSGRRQIACDGRRAHADRHPLLRPSRPLRR